VAAVACRDNPVSVLEAAQALDDVLAVVPERGRDRAMGRCAVCFLESMAGAGVHTSPTSCQRVFAGHVTHLLNQRNVFCLNRNHLFSAIRLGFAHNALPTQRNLLNWLVRKQLMEAIKANLLNHQIGSFSQGSRYWSRVVTPAGSEVRARAVIR
jgi:hypothetical protein